MLLALDGFDKYGATNSNSTVVAGLLTAGEWTSTNATVNIVAGLSATGYALSLAMAGANLTKTLSGSYPRLMGGLRFSHNLTATSGISFLDSASVQCSIIFNTNGTIAVRNGIYNTGTILGTTATSITANTTHYLEWDITFNNSGSYQLWLDGVSVLSGSGDTTTTANNSITGFQFIGSSGSVMIVDDLYIFDTTGSTNNSVLLSSPRIETQFPTSDGAVQFAVGAATLGSSITRTTGVYNASANNLYLRPYTPSRNCTLNAIGILGSVTASATLQLRPLLYADTGGGAPGALLSAGSVVVGIAVNSIQTMPLTTPQNLIAGTQYWLGYMCDLSTSNNISAQDATNLGRNQAVAFSSGAPATAPSMITGIATVTLWGIVSNTGSNAYEVAQNPAQGAQSYLFDATVGHEDLYNLPPLSVTPAAIYGVAVKANVGKSDTGVRTVSVRTKSGATDSAGAAASMTLPQSYGWLTSLFPTDPNTGAAWTASGLNAAQHGLRIDA